jgi:hypothetical protein
MFKELKEEIEDIKLIYDICILKKLIRKLNTPSKIDFTPLREIYAQKSYLKKN